MDLSNFLSVPRATLQPPSFKHTPSGKQNVYFCPELNSPISSRHYSTSTESEYSSSQRTNDSRIILGEITESVVDEMSSLSSSMISMFYDRADTQLTESSTNEATLTKSKITKREKKKQKGKLLEQNLKNYNSVPTKESKVLRY